MEVLPISGYLGADFHGPPRRALPLSDCIVAQVVLFVKPFYKKIFGGALNFAPPWLASGLSSLWATHTSLPQRHCRCGACPSPCDLSITRFWEFVYWQNSQTCVSEIVQTLQREQLGSRTMHERRARAGQEIRKSDYVL